MSMNMDKRRRRNVRAKHRVLQNRLGIMFVSGVIVILAVVLMFASFSSLKKWKNQGEQIAQLKSQLAAEEVRAEEIEELDEYVGSDEYIEDVARENRLVYPNEILFQAK